MFTIGAWLAFIIGLAGLIGAIVAFSKRENVVMGIMAVLTVAGFAGGSWFQTHRIVSVNQVGVSRATFTQELSRPYPAGIMPKPFFGKVYQYPASTNYERCETYTPAIKGSYGITLDLCYYFNTGTINWKEEIKRTGHLDAGAIMNVWRNSVVGDVAKSVKIYTPEALSEQRAEVEGIIFENVTPWFSERGVELASISFKNWDFSSEAVGAAFDESIQSQREITVQAALFQAAKISRERETYEAETARLVSEKQKEALNLLGLEGDAAVDYLWIKYLGEQGQTPDVLILGTGGAAPVSIPFREPKLDD